ncbi:MAG: hypothetical protein LW808_002385 [Verrucomicrobiota bacterium]|nr:MAG: hypothetical protein LW808_002385 [Verrucomicrobiota bacterium]
MDFAEETSTNIFNFAPEFLSNPLDFRPRNSSNYPNAEPRSLLDSFDNEPTIQRKSFDFTPRLSSVSSLLESNNINYDAYPQLEINNPIQTSTLHSLPISQEYAMLPPAIPMLLPTPGIDNTQNAQRETEPIQDQFVSHIQTPIAQSTSMVESSSSSLDINEAVEIPDDVSTQSESDEIAPTQLTASQSQSSESVKKNKNTTSNARRGKGVYKDFPPIDPQNMLPKDVKQAQKDCLLIGKVRVTNTSEAPWLVAAITWYFSHQRLIRAMNDNPENLRAQRIHALRNQVKQYRERVLRAQQLLKPDAFQALMLSIRALFPNATQNFIIKEFNRKKTQMLKYLECLEPKCEGDLQKLIANGLGRLKGVPDTMNSTVTLPDPVPAKNMKRGHKPRGQNPVQSK